VATTDGAAGISPEAGDRVLAKLDDGETVRLACDLIRIPSFTTEETPCAEWLANYLAGQGLEVELQEIEPGRFQTIATLPGAGGGASLMLNGHTDINALTSRWKRDPWTPSLEGDHLYGHGVQNMKGGLASIIMAAVRNHGDTRGRTRRPASIASMRAFNRRAGREAAICKRAGECPSLPAAMSSRNRE